MNSNLHFGCYLAENRLKFQFQGHTAAMAASIASSKSDGGGTRVRRYLKRGELCYVTGRYRRTIGNFINRHGKIAPKKFLLGTDRLKAEVANLRLEQLWADVVRQFEERGGRDDGSEQPGTAPPLAQPIWTTEALLIAEHIRKGDPQIPVAPPVEESGSAHSNVGVIYLKDERPDHAAPIDERASAYRLHLEGLKQRYPSVAFFPQEIERYRHSHVSHQNALMTLYGYAVEEAIMLADMAGIPAPVIAGQSLYQALDAFAEHVRQDRQRGGETTEWGKVLASGVLRLKDAGPDMPLHEFNLAAIEGITRYWKKRPPQKRTGKAIALQTVRHQLKVLQMFCSWMHCEQSINWRKPDDAERMWRCDLTRLMTSEEVAGLKNGVAVYSLDHLGILYRCATDQQRVLLLLGLNCGFARAECCSVVAGSAVPVR
jgi:hypothetical protein